MSDICSSKSIVFSFHPSTFTQHCISKTAKSRLYTGVELQENKPGNKATHAFYAEYIYLCSEEFIRAYQSSQSDANGKHGLLFQFIPCTSHVFIRRNDKPKILIFVTTVYLDPAP